MKYGFDSHLTLPIDKERRNTRLGGWCESIIDTTGREIEDAGGFYCRNSGLLEQRYGAPVIYGDRYSIYGGFKSI
jgi:hypothetical protein